MCFKNLALLLILALIPGCMFKSVMNDEADDILRARICEYKGESYLVMMEGVFQAVSKENRRGVSFTSGFYDNRLSVYNTSDGSLKVRKDMGRQTRNPVEFLGYSPGRIWLYSMQEGIHSLDPETLDVNITQDSIFKVNPELRDNLALCDWYQLPMYFQFNGIIKIIILTDRVGYRYALDASTLSASSIEGEYKDFKPDETTYFKTYLAEPYEGLNISGDLRKRIKVRNADISPGLSFLDGQFIVELNPENIFEDIESRLSGLMVMAERLYPLIMDLNSLNNGRGPEWGTSLRDSLRDLERAKDYLERNIRELESCRSDIMDDGKSHRYNQLLSIDTTSFFVFHRANTSKESNALISRIEIKGGKEIRELWRTEIDELFFDPSAARETNVFKEVFSKGDPEFRFNFFGIADNKLVFVWMLHAQCIDADSGELLWKFRI